MPKTDISALLDALHQAGKPPDNGTSETDSDGHDEAVNDQRERLELRQEAAKVGLVVHAATDPEMLRSLITRKAFIDQHAKDTLEPCVDPCVWRIFETEELTITTYFQGISTG